MKDSPGEHNKKINPLPIPDNSENKIKIIFYFCSYSVLQSVTVIRINERIRNKYNKRRYLKDSLRQSGKKRGQKINLLI